MGGRAYLAAHNEVVCPKAVIIPRHAPHTLHCRHWMSSPYICRAELFYSPKTFLFISCAKTVVWVGATCSTCLMP